MGWIWEHQNYFVRGDFADLWQIEFSKMENKKSREGVAGLWHIYLSKCKANKIHIVFLTHSHTHSTWSGYGSGYVEWVWSGYKMKKWSGYKMGWSGYEMWYFSNLEWVWEWVSRTHNEKIYFLYLYYFVCKDLIIRSQNIDNFVSFAFTQHG